MAREPKMPMRSKDLRQQRISDHNFCLHAKAIGLMTEDLTVAMEFSIERYFLTKVVKKLLPKSFFEWGHYYD
jgi:hypothetical protein